MCYGTTKSKVDEWRSKAYSVTKSHIKRWRRDWGENPRGAERFATLYGWVAQDVADDMQTAFKGRCPYCRAYYRDIGDGSNKQLTVDIVDPKAPPYYETNVKMCCVKCNSMKQDKGPTEWGRYLRNVATYRAIVDG